MTKYLVTGGSGFLGEALIERLYAKYPEIHLVTVARDEGGLVKLTEQYPELEAIPGDISDPYVCTRACKDVEGIFHLAAFKHVGLAEINTRQCVQSNVVGTMNLLDETLRNIPRFIIGISTDKAAQVHGIYGASKLIQERLFQEYSRLNPGTRYRTVRYGNVLYSTGSVLCKWKERLQNGGEIIITDPRATRFYWSVGEAIDLIFQCLAEAPDAEPYVPQMKAVSIGVLLEAMIEKYSLVPPVIRQIGLQQGESLHEIIQEGGPNSSEVEQYTHAELLAVI